MTPHSLDDIRAERAARRLMPFVEMFWHVVEPRAPFVNNWHLGFIAEHLEAVHLGQILDLLINIPPGCMKSLLVSVFFMAWEWTRRPELRYLGGSYQETLAVRDAMKSRDVITSDLYQRYWPLALSDDQNTKTKYQNEKSGWRIATSVGGRGTGEHPHRKIVDDPHNASQALSDVQRKAALDWFSQTLASRGAALKAATILIMQRLHEEDLSGHVRDTMPGVFTEIVLPMRYEPPAWVEVQHRKVPQARMAPTCLGRQDSRTQPGELLWPALFPEPTLQHLETQLRSTMGEYGVAGQYQQRPAPEAGGMFKREWFTIVDALPADAQLIARARGWDAAGTEGGGDYTAGVRLSWTRDGLFYVEDVVRGQWGPDHADANMKLTVQTDPPATRQREEQEPGSSGKKVVVAHAKLLAGYDYLGESTTGDKATNARPFAAQCAVGNVKLLRGPWNKDYIDELSGFPNGKHDDQVDASSRAFNEIALGPTVTTRKVTGW